MAILNSTSIDRRYNHWERRGEFRVIEVRGCSGRGRSYSFFKIIILSYKALKYFLFA